MSEPESVAESVIAPESNKPRRGVLWRSFRRAIRISIYLILVFVAIILIGLIPVNNDFQPAPDGVEIYVTSNPVHAEIVLPIQSTVIDWRNEFSADSFPSDTSWATHVAVGWGDRGFFLKTPTWADFKVSVAANALFLPSETCLHVTMKGTVVTGANTRAVRISNQQYAQLVGYIKDAFRRDTGDGLLHVNGEHYSSNDAFFEAEGTYHFLNTCNSWVGRGLQATGVRIGWLTPLPKTVFWYL